MIRTRRNDEARREHCRWLRRQAVHIVAQLPENEEEALKVLSFARELIIQFVGEDADGRDRRVIALIAQADLID